jgi:hypothetical protein
MQRSGLNWLLTFCCTTWHREREWMACSLPTDQKGVGGFNSREKPRKKELNGKELRSSFVAVKMHGHQVEVQGEL